MKVAFVPEALTLLDDAVNRLASTLPDPIEAPIGDDFRWKYPEDTAEVLLVLKSVRLVTSLAGAWHLANVGLTTEAGSLCRQIDDFSGELWFVAESILKGAQNAAQRQFIQDFFRPAASSVAEYLEQEKVRYVSRADIARAAQRISEEAGGDTQLLKETSSYLTYGLNKYTHGAYETAMEIYHGGHRRFMILGAEGRPRAASIEFVASKATEACFAVAVAALAMNQHATVHQIRTFIDRADPDVGRNSSSA